MDLFVSKIEEVRGYLRGVEPSLLASFSSDGHLLTDRSGGRVVCRHYQLCWACGSAYDAQVRWQRLPVSYTVLSRCRGAVAYSGRYIR